MTNLIFKIKHHGMTLKCRRQLSGELIKSTSLQLYLGDDITIEMINEDVLARTANCWKPSKHVGQVIDGFKDRVFIEVVSLFYQGESTAWESCRKNNGKG
jgi:hypothetical protein